MTQDTRTIENKLRWSQDQQSANAVIQSNKAIADSFAGIQTQTAAETLVIAKLQQGLAGLERSRVLQQLAKDAAAGVTPLDQVVQKLDAMNASDAELIRLAKDMDTFAISAQKAADASGQITAPPRGIRDIGIQSQDELPFPDLGSEGDVSGGGGGINPSILTTAGRLVGGTGGHVLRAAGQASRLADMLPEDTNALIQLGAAGLIAAPALIATKVALDNFNKEVEQSKALLTAGLSAETNYYSALKNFTTKQVQDQIAILDKARPALQQQAAELQGAIESGFKQAQAQFGDAGARALDAAGKSPYKQLQDQLDGVNKELESNTQSEARYQQGLTNGAFAANDAAAAEVKLQKAREASASQLIAAFDQDANARVQLAQLRRTGTVDQVNAELDANKDRETIIRQFLLPAVQSLGLTTDAAKKRTEELNTELANLTDNDTLLVQAVLPVVSAREAEVALLKAQKDASDALNPILQDINKAQVDLGQASEKTATALAAVGQAETDHASKLADIQATYDDAEAKALTTKNQQLAKIDAQAAERALEQRENDNLSIVQAVAHGDLAQVQQILAQQKVRDTQAQRQVQQQKDDAQKSYDDQLKAADVQRTKLLASEQDRYSKERQQRQAAYDQAFQDQQALNNRLKSLRDLEQFTARSWISAQVTALYKVQDATGGFVSQMKSYADQINSYIQSGGAAWKPVDSTGWATVNGSKPPPSYSGYKEVSGAGSKLPAISGYQPYPGSGKTIGTFDEPSFNTKPGIYRSMVPEYHIPVADFNRLGAGRGGNPLTFNVSDADVVEKIVKAVRPVIEQSGEAWAVRVVKGIAANHQSIKKGGQT